MAALEPPVPASGGERIDHRFALLSLAGAGGMGSVYKASDDRTGRPVAVKLLKKTSEAEDLERFAREAQLLSELVHPGIVTYVAHGTTPEGQPFLAMEWLEGEDLASRLSRGPLQLPEALVLLRKVAEALAIAHDRGVIHRDLKPGNLFLRDGEIERVALVDFGLARRASAAFAMTRTGVIIGTPAYMAPEQACGDRQITPATDIFSLGCVLFECLTGQTPFVADHLRAMLARILFDEPTTLRSLRPEMPESVEALISRMLAKGTGERLRGARDLLDALDRLDEQRPHAAPREPEREQQLLSVIMAMPPPEGDDLLSPTASTITYSNVSELLAALTRFGAEPITLADGSLLAPVRPKKGSATDLAAEAARAALLIQSAWPDATIAAVTGRGLSGARTTVGEVFDRAAELLRKNPDAKQVLLDEVTAGLLGLRFAIDTSESGTRILRHGQVTDTARPLLGKPTPCVGREIEIAMLESALAATISDSELHAVLVTAAPGAGKSRIKHELLRRIDERGDEVTVVVGRGDPFVLSASHGVLGGALRAFAGLSRGSAESEQRAMFAERIGSMWPEGERTRALAFLGELCGLPFAAEGDPVVDAARRDPQLLSDHVALWVADFFRKLACMRPVLIVLEDVHWADAPTLKITELMVRELSSYPIMLFGLARPEIEESSPGLWGFAAQKVKLAPLSKKAGEKLARHLLGKSAQNDMIGRIVAQAEGNALFLEELIRAAAEGHGQEAPGTVIAMLQARIGRLSPHARRALRAASVLFASCSREGLAALCGNMSEVDLERGTSDLITEEILEERRDLRGRELRFRHALMRDAAYSLIDDEERARAHRGAAEYLLSSGEPDAGLVAQHYLWAKDPKSAVPHLLRATEQALEANNLPALLSAAERGLACEPAGEARGIFLSFVVDRHLWGQRYEQALTTSLEALSLLPEGGRHYYSTLQYLFAAASYLQRADITAEWTAKLAAARPAEAARSEYAKAAGWLVATLAADGNKDASRRLLDQAARIGETLPPGDILTKAHIQTAHATYFTVVEDAPWSCARANGEARDALRRAGEQRTQLILSAAYASGLLELGDVTGAQDDIAATVARAERLNETLPLAFCRLALAEILCQSRSADNLDDPVRLAEWVLSTNNLRLARSARAVLAEVKRRQGDFHAAEEHARAVFAALSRFPALTWEPIADLSEIVREAGRLSEALSIAEEGLATLLRLGVSGRGELDLRLALVEALLAQDRQEEAKAQLSAALPRLRMRVDNIPEGEHQARYLSANPRNARLTLLLQEHIGVSVI